ncbi:hypothetical protein B0H14DRAFT_2734447 [Mycena olivaceomarginata]|nr:hypothetical protein B0H14DRAFT_2734447 [Mycena olivaceomarginata]
MALLFLYVLFSLFAAKLSLSTDVSANYATGSSLTTRAASPLTFAGANWIWGAKYTANTLLALRKDFVPPFGKSLIAAEIVTTASNISFYVNGEFIGPGASLLGRWNLASNVFAATSLSLTVPPAAMIAAIRVTYDDFTTDEIVTDTSWRTNPWVAGSNSCPSTTQPGPQLSSRLPTPARRMIQQPSLPIPRSIPLNLGQLPWFWTDAIPASGTIPAGSRAFRRTFTPLPGQVPMSASIIITVDDSYTLWVNNVEIGTNNGFSTAEQYTVNFVSAPSEIVFAVLATNKAAGAAGILFAAEINMVPTGRANCTAGAWVNGDADWVSTTGAIPTGWQLPGFDDSAWPLVVGEGNYPAAPWNTVTIAAVSSHVNV